MQRLEQIAETYSWYQSYGNDVENHGLARYVRNLEHPDVWTANHVSSVRARNRAEIDEVLQHADRSLSHCGHRMAIVDPLTPDAFTARLALQGYRELSPTLQMVLEGPLAASGANAACRPVTSEDDWRALYALVRVDHVEGKVTFGMTLDAEITRGIVAGYRSKSAVSQFFLATLDGIECAYGSAVLGPWSMGIVEDLFTLPAYRGRGLATMMIRHVVDHARERGMGPMLVGAHVDQAPKALYASLGFVPQCLTRLYLLEAGHPMSSRSA